MKGRAFVHQPSIATIVEIHRAVPNILDGSLRSFHGKRRAFSVAITKEDCLSIACELNVGERTVTQVFENVFVDADRNLKIVTVSKTLSLNLQFKSSPTIFSPAHAVILAIVALTIRNSYKVHDALTFAQPVWNNVKIWVLIADHDRLCIIQNRIDTIYH